MDSTFRQKIKSLILGSARPMKIFFGLAKGIKMNFNPLYESQIILGTYEFEISSIFKTFAKRADIFLDIGSANGYYSLIYRKYNPQGYCYLIDGDPKFAEKQIENLQLNNINERFEIISKYVSEVESEGTVVIDKLLNSSKQAKNTILGKIDVEGAEYQVLKGMKSTLDEYDCKLIIETHSAELEKECISYLEAKGYKTEIINNSWVRRILKEGRVIPHNRWLSAEKNRSK